MKRIVAVLILSLPLLTAACNTMEGLGQDIQKGGENLEHSANEGKN